MNELTSHKGGKIMKNSVICFLESIVQKFPDKIAIVEGEKSGRTL